MRFTVDRIDHVVLNCHDPEAMAAWYQRVLGMDREDFGPDHRIALKFGGQKLNLRPVDTSDPKWTTGAHAEAGAGDLCFITAVRPDDVLAYLHACEVAIEAGPVPREGALGAMASIYCRDPEGNLVEIGSYFDS